MRLTLETIRAFANNSGIAWLTPEHRHQTNTFASHIDPVFVQSL
jgi:hypothetical protein